MKHLMKFLTNLDWTSVGIYLLFIFGFTSCAIQQYQSYVDVSSREKCVNFQIQQKTLYSEIEKYCGPK